MAKDADGRAVDDRLLDLALALAEGTDLPTVAPGDVEPGPVAALRAIQQLARQRRATEAQVYPPLSRWGHLTLLERFEVPIRMAHASCAARDEALGREVILRTIGPLNGDPLLVQRYLDAARSHSQVSHPHLATILGADYSNDLVGCWHERVSGQPLREAIAAGTFRSVDAAVALLLSVSDALGALHRAGLANGGSLPDQVVVVNQRALLVPAVWPADPLDAETPGRRTDMVALGELFIAALTAGTMTADVPARTQLARLGKQRPDVSAAILSVIDRALEPDGELQQAGAFGAALATAYDERQGTRERLVGFTLTLVLVVALICYALSRP